MAKAIIYQSELDFIAKCVLDYPDEETGGDFFGFWNKDGFPVVQYVIGPGPKTTRSSISFYQDIQYLKQCGALLNARHCLEHIGSWHSHHTLGLAKPSRGDINTMQNALNNYGVSSFLISICNITKNEVVVNGFLFSGENADMYEDCAWVILEGQSPVREDINQLNNKLFSGPEVKEANVKPANTATMRKEKTAEKPVLPKGSYFETTQGQEYLKKVYAKLESNRELEKVDLVQKEDARIGIKFNYDGDGYEIIFPHEFPEKSPQFVQKASRATLTKKIKKLLWNNEKQSVMYIQDALNAYRIRPEWNTKIIIIAG